MVRLTRTADFSDTVLFSFNVNGTYIYIAVPNDCLSETHACDSEIGALLKNDDFDVNSSDWMPEKRVLKTSLPYWEASTELALNPGRVMIQILDIRTLESAKSKNLFACDQHRQMLFEITQKLRKILVAARCNEKYYVFPESLDEINIISNGELRWAQTQAGYAEAAPADITFVTPLSNELLLVIDTNTKMFNYGTEDENAAMRAEAEADLFEFVKAIRIDFSPEIQAQIDAARTAENA